MNEKTIYVRRGQVLTVESLQDGVTGEGFFLVKNEEGEAVRASEIRTAEGVVFTADESKRVFSQNGLEYDIYLSLKQHLEDGSAWGINRHQHSDYGEVQYMRAKDIAKVVNDDHELRIGVGAQAIWKICKSLGMRTFRIAEGGAVVLEEADIATAEAKFAPQQANKEMRTIYRYPGGVWVEEEDATQMLRFGAEGEPETMLIPITAPLPN